jgi:hypothetical protein
MGEFMTTSKITLAATAGLLLGLSASANAADLGSGCCADLEERVAELEATTARKGNRVVSLQVYGQVNRALLIWDDGEESDIYSVDANESGTRFGFIGAASIKPGWTAGYKIEVNARASEQANATQDETPEDEVDLAHSYLWIESEQLGRLTLGKTDSATDGIDDIVLANVLQGRGTNEGSFEVQGAAGNNTIGDFVAGFTAQNDDLVRYDSPSIAGFIVSAAWVDLDSQDQDFYDVTLRYSAEFNAFRVAAGIGYSVLEGVGADDDQETVAGSASVMHVPTGLFAAFGMGEQDNLTDPDDKDFWHVTAGIEKNFFGYGATTVYGEYGEYSNLQDDADGSDAEVLGFGIVQTIDSAAMDVYAQYRLYSFEDGDAGDEEDFSSILVGSRIKF